MTALVIALNSWRESLRSRFFLLTAVFACVVLYLSLLLGLLAVDQELRVLLDFGLGFIELMGLAGALYGAATVILREMETKTIYLILSRPVGRGEYLLGRFLGLMLSVLAAMALMALAHLALLLMKGWAWEGRYAWALLGAYLKVMTTASLTVFLALSTTSVLSALSIAGILWSLGHFLPEIRFLVAHRARHQASAPLMALAYVIPDLNRFNLRDRLDALPGAPAELSLWGWLLYAVLYSSAWLSAAYLLMRKKEF